MSVTILKAPNDLSLSADLITARFLAVDAVGQIAVKAVNELNISTNIAPGVMFHWYYGPSAMIMTSAAVPDASGTQFLAGSGSPVPAATLIPYFKANSRLNSDFDITAVAGKVRFTAKVPGAKFNCVPDTADMTLIVEGKSESFKENYSIGFSLYLENEDHSGFDKIYNTSLQLLPGTNEAEVRIGDKLHVAITDTIRKRLPEQPLGEVIECKNSARKYYFDYNESYGNPVENHSYGTSGIFTVIHGGLSSLAQSKTTIKDLISPGAKIFDRFLKQGSNEVMTRPNQPQYLYFFNTREARSVDLVFDFSFYGEETIHREVIEDISMEGFRKYAFDTSFQNVYLAPIAGKVVDYYKVYLTEAGNRVSEERLFKVDYNMRNFVRYFLSWSSMGALDSRLCYGKGTSEFELFNKSASRILQIGESIQYGHSYTFDSQIKRSFKVATGWLDRSEITYNIDFFLSNFKYRYSAGTMLPIYIDPGTVKEITDGDFNLSQVFDYRYHFLDHAYTDGDAEDQNMSIGIYFYTHLGYSNGAEIDPTVPAWVKAITLADIARWNANGAGEVVPAPASAQTGGFFTILWDAAKKAKYGNYGRFLVEMGSSYEQVPITITKDGTGKPTAYTFNLSAIDSLIHFI